MIMKLTIEEYEKKKVDKCTMIFSVLSEPKYYIFKLSWVKILYNLMAQPWKYFCTYGSL